MPVLGSRTGEAAFDTADNRLRFDLSSAFCSDSRRTLALRTWQVVAPVASILYRDGMHFCINCVLLDEWRVACDASFPTATDLCIRLKIKGSKLDIYHL